MRQMWWADVSCAWARAEILRFAQDANRAVRVRLEEMELIALRERWEAREDDCQKKQPERSAEGPRHSG